MGSTTVWHMAKLSPSCGVNAHHQNGVTKKRIRDLQEAAHATLIHAKRRWPEAIETSLWPYALSSASHALNHTPSPQTHEAPIALFLQNKDPQEICYFHTFGCLAYVRDAKLQGGTRQPCHKWEDRAWVSIHLGPSPSHGKSVALLLNLSMGMVSPQFHIKYNDHFDAHIPPLVAAPLMDLQCVPLDANWKEAVTLSRTSYNKEL